MKLPFGQSPVIKAALSAWLKYVTDEHYKKEIKRQSDAQEGEIND
jgi:hypothetical protein